MTKTDPILDVLTRMRAASAFVDPPGAMTPLLDALEKVLRLHYPVEVEPSDTICGECSYRLPNGRYFGKVVEHPCPTIRAVTAALLGGESDA